MNLVERTVREHLSEEAQDSAEGISEIRSFCEHIKKDSLNVKVHQALAFKSQGHFDKAMSNIAGANRDQVTAIRKIQKLVGQARGEEYPEVVFEKFRQFDPFEIGLSDADAVLSILAELDGGDDPQHKEVRSKFHGGELRKKDEEDYLSFLENRLDEESASEDVIRTRENIISLTRTLNEQRNWILKKILVVVSAALKEMPSGIGRDRILLELAHNIFLVITSPILTKPAAHVESER